jgi:hypothetical protein
LQQDKKTHLSKTQNASKSNGSIFVLLARQLKLQIYAIAKFVAFPKKNWGL